MAPDGGYILAGQTYSLGAGDRDVCVVKTSAQGEMEWSKLYGGPDADVGHYVTVTEDGDFLITGYTVSLAVEDDDPYLIKIGPKGEYRWAQVMSLPGVNHSLTGEEAAGGGYFLTGFSQYMNKGTRAALLIRTDVDGRLVWHRDILPTSEGESFGYTIRATSDGGCVFTGHTSVGSAGDHDLLLFRLAGPEKK